MTQSVMKAAHRDTMTRARTALTLRPRPHVGVASSEVPSTGLEPVQLASEASALSSELRGRTDRGNQRRYPRFCRNRHLSQPRRTKRPSSLAMPGLARAARPRRNRCDGTEHRRSPKGKGAWPSPPALLPWSPRLRTNVAVRTLARRASFHPYSDVPSRSSLCCGCRHTPSRDVRPHLLFREAHMYVAVGKFL